MSEVSTGSGTMSFNDGLIWIETGRTLDVEAELNDDLSAEVGQPVRKALARSTGPGL